MTWTVPNILTVLRLLAAPGVAIMFLYFNRPWADWLALTLFIGAAITDWFDGYLARLWKQESRFGAMLDPIADKAMVLIALLVITGFSGMNPWILLPATLIFFRETFVSGLREFLGATAGTLKVTKLAKWKTTAQMVSIGILFWGTGLDYLNHAGGPESSGLARLSEGPAGWVTFFGVMLLWVAAALTLITGWDYFRKALPHLRDPS
ncbi:CDP-diacylglycerol--glycerol-3-phosphate 3-phosphatidyltransferase [Wenxinia saemankumensis]|uniref:CDP-diacylglycerol--glycerol-3-phosphate 3-phosphatidyltransferase n=1 Tax=Wenxinia saemankumensis TaxID=1447782 RepID=A0A1M6DTC1_9RHOB|nr:CDP-diacylglycerol--glycerol-3-phosphate 3-phosphatidyltransferase [Wenxinia saemankumensis]SHI76425.1 CDP-diacylglycerol--glycerol-3-phosphate 3-phosphatidyltransferase [Wenxinia saemankumensis]